MVVAFFIIGISSALFACWFRYTVILIQRSRSGQGHAVRAAAANRLHFIDVREKLHAPMDVGSLRGLSKALQHDYRVLTYLVGHAANLQAGHYTAEQRLLMLNFRLMTIWFAATAPIRPTSAKLALLEMCSVLEYFANVMGERSGVPASVAVRA